MQGKRGEIMKYLKQFGIILFISFLGEMLNSILPLPIPASIYGLVLLFLLLRFKVLHIDSIKETGKFLIEIMPLMFIPAGVGLLESWNVLKPMWVVICIMTVVSTIVVMAVTGTIAQWVIRLQKKNE